MREYKFRVWDKISKIMYYNTSLHIVWTGGVDTCITGEDCPHKNISNKYTMQYTGLKDKNGVEIYEGDIVVGNTSFENYNDELEWTRNNPATVEWYEKCGGFYPFLLNVRRRCDVENIEVIGNIYENPNLLKGE